MRASGGHDIPGDGPERPGPAASDVPARDEWAPPRPVPARLTTVLRVSFVLRGAALWFAVHLGMAFLGQLLFSPVQIVFLLCVVYVGVAVDQRARREDLLLGNAGIAPWVGPGHAMAAAATLEGVAQVGLARVMGVMG